MYLTHKKSLLFAFLSLFICLVFIGCKKREKSQNDTETQSLIDNALIDQEFMSIIPSAINYLAIAQENSGKSEIVSDCYTISILAGDTTDFVPNMIYQVTINNVTCSEPQGNQKSRRGQLIIHANGKLNQVHTQLNIKLNNYEADGLKFACDSILVEIRLSNESQLKLNAEIHNGSCLGAEFTILYHSSNEITLNKIVSGSSHEWLSSVTGKSIGSNRFGLSFETKSDTLNPIVMSTNCKYFTKGFQEITNKDLSTFMVNYGKGECDDKASYNIFENTVEFKLK